MVFDTDAAGLKAILEHSVAAGGNQAASARSAACASPTTRTMPPAPKIVNVSLTDQNGVVIRRVIENGAVSSDAPSTITVSTTSFTANGGDGYPTKAVGGNFRFLLANGLLGLPVRRGPRLHPRGQHAVERGWGTGRAGGLPSGPLRHAGECLRRRRHAPRRWISASRT